MEGTEPSQRRTTDAPPTVNYLPATPALSDRPDVLERIFTSLFRRRGSRPVLRIRRD